MTETAHRIPGSAATRLSNLSNLGTVDRGVDEVLGVVAQHAGIALPAGREVRLLLQSRHRRYVWEGAGPRAATLGSHDDRHAQVLTRTLDSGATTRGVGTVAVPLHAGSRVIGALVVTATADHDVAESEIEGIEASIVLYSVMSTMALALVEAQEQVGHLEKSLQNRAVIERAKGVLMARHQIDADGAFAILKDRSQRGNQKVVAVATQLVAELPGGC